MSALLNEQDALRADILARLNADLFSDHAAAPPLSEADRARVRRDYIKSVIGVRVPDEYDY